MKERSVLMAQAGGEGAAGGAGVEPAAAREFVSGFVPDPKILEGMKDDQVMAYHGQVNKVLGEHITKARESFDWRKDIAGEDPDAMTTLQRLQSPKALWESYRELRTKVSKGELKAVVPFPEKGTEDDKANWRAANGVPPAPDKYEFKLPAGMEITDADKPAIESLTKFAHGKNLPATQVNEVVNWYFAERAAREDKLRAEFETKKTETAAALGQEWGQDYRPNINKIQGLLDATIPADQEELKVLINNAIATNPHFARHYAAIALQMNPAGTLGPAGMGANEGSIVDEIKKIETVIKTKRKDYDGDEAMQSRYRDLIGAYQRLSGKEWGAQS